jgi:membrane protein YqaA with SNARE-associated domain
LKAFVARMMAKWKLVVLPALLKLGFWGVGAVALLDSSSIPVPMDAILALYVWNDKGHFWLYCLMAAVGSAIGGLLPYGLGRAGGELFLLKRVNRERFEAMRTRFERQEFLAMMIPSMLPPPTPWKAFVFAAGVFEMRVPAFCWRCLSAGWCAGWFCRLSCSSWVQARSSSWRITLCTLVGGAMVLAGLGFAWWWWKRRRAGTLVKQISCTRSDGVACG